MDGITSVQSHNIENMSSEIEQKRLLEDTMLRCFYADLDGLNFNDMLTVYFFDGNNSIYSALVPSSESEKTLSDPSYDLFIGKGLPAAITCFENGENETRYFRYGVENGIEPLVINRGFHDLKYGYNEISEEFRFFHNLYHDKKTDRYFKIDDAGNENLIAIVERDRIKIRKKEICQFLAIKEMHLLLQFDYRETSLYSLTELGLKENVNIQNKNQEFVTKYDCYEIDEGKSFARLLGKQLIAPLPKSKSGFEGFSEDPIKNEVKFIIGFKENGDERYSVTSDAYLTEVHFRKQVLDKYYQNPSKYSVEDSYLRCGSLWGTYIDNMHDDKVCAWLGDIERDLPYQEQLHWQQYNIPPAGNMSAVFLANQIFCKYTDSSQAEHLFKKAYSSLQSRSHEILGWHFFMPLHSADEYHLKRIKIPSTEEQGDFDILVLALTKILMDSLNVEKIKQWVSPDPNAPNGSINLLKRVFSDLGINNASAHISFLKDLQNLRSTGTAHRKGSNYEKIIDTFGGEYKTLQSISSNIISSAVAFICYIDELVKTRRFPLGTM